jgi:hypothetical protein
MAKFQLAFGIHNHQPVGNFEHIFEEAHQRAYLPFLRLLEENEHVSISLHQSGILWDWQEKHHPEYLETVKRLVESGRIELLTGGFYEPILCSIPERDSFGQIAMLNEFIGSRFGTEPTGLWLTERIWEPHLPRLLAQAGVKYLPIDDTHFIYAGFEHDQLTGPFVTENEGHTVVLLPIRKQLRYLIPFGTVEEVIAELRGHAEKDPSGMLVYADDGEKFGVWPNTHQHCYEEGWLADLFEAVKENSDWLELVPLGKVAGRKAVGRAYIPSASYEEMLHWALPVDAYLEYEQLTSQLKDSKQWERYGRFVRGGHWRGFLAKYEESNLMHKKMIRVSNRLADFERRYPKKLNQASDARDRLYASQCNCPYWHGVFGGIYLPHIRQAVYGCMIEADNSLRSLLGESGLTTEVSDFDADGSDEVIMADNQFTAVFRPATGGALVDLSLNQHHFALADTMTRRREGYHEKLTQVVEANVEDKTASIHDIVLAKEEGLADYLVQDWYYKRCFIDHFFAENVTPEMFRTGRFGDEGDFVLEPYQHKLISKSRCLEMTRNGHLWRHDGSIPVRVMKRFTFAPEGDRIGITYELTSPGDSAIDVQFAIENNFSFQAGHADDRYLLIDNERSDNSFLDSVGEHRQVNGLAMVDEYRSLAVAVCSEQAADIWHLPIFTVSLSEGGFERVYQGTTILHVYRVRLSQQPLTIKLNLFAGTSQEVLERAFATQAVSG